MDTKPEDDYIIKNANDKDVASPVSAVQKKPSSSPIPSSLPNDHGILISVGNPSKQGESMKDSYTTYEVTTKVVIIFNLKQNIIFNETTLNLIIMIMIMIIVYK